MALMDTTLGRIGGLWNHYVATSVRDHPASEETDHVATTSWILVVVALALTGLHFTKGAPPAWWSTHLVIGDQTLTGLVWWGLMNVVWYVVPALVVIRYVLRRPVREFGLDTTGFRSHLPLYAAMLAVMVPVVVAVSFSAHFQQVYPFYRPALVDGVTWRLGIWWLVYASQFVALEFFFRGFMVHGLRPHLGFASVLVMMVPYTMIHFQKPPLEATAAIAAGLVLGAVSLRTRSIWLGAMLHISVAATMDLAALAHAGRLWW